MERLVDDAEPTIIMDNGQASFVPLTRYLVECDALSLLEEAGRRSYVHCVVTGGQLGPSTLSGLEQILSALADSAQIAVWRNAYFGPIDEEAYQTIVGRAGPSPGAGSPRSLVQALRGLRSGDAPALPHLRGGHRSPTSVL